VFADHVRTPDLLRSRAATLFDWVCQRKLKVSDGGECALADAANARADMWSRKASGKPAPFP